MPKIQVPPELLIQVAEKFRLQSLQMEWMISSLDHQMNAMLMWEGTTRQRFFEDFHRARSEMTRTIEYMSSISDELKRIAYRFILVDEELLPLALVGRKEEPKTWLEKAWGSLKELGNGIMDASNERYDKRYSSVWSFLDYWTAGIPKGAYQGYVERADKLFDSPNDFANGMTFGVHGTIREAIFPTKAWSTEHVASIIGAAGIATGATVPLMKPKDILSPRVKYEVRKGNDGLQRDEDGGGTPKKVEGADNGGSGESVVLNKTIISPEIEQKILFGRRNEPTSKKPNGVVGGHSPNINNSHPDFAVEELRINPDGTKDIKFYTQFPDGKISNVKSSTIFPDSWTDTEVINAVKEVGDKPSIGTRVDIEGVKTLHTGTVNGVKIDVIKMGDDVISAYPVGTKPTPGFK
ncbi:EndoU domain-containing protein [Paenibacillus sp. FSL W7-1332]|uniref:EndoU domain-containing protein n=1 Tax=Paenibacillus sp. FSL W7-1332 TaxID=2921702 RepID=UPI0030D2D33F